LMKFLNAMSDQSPTRAKLRTPQAAAVAGILFSLLAMTSFLLLWLSVPADPQEPGGWLHGSSGVVALAVNLMPFSGIALLWFIAVLRDRMGESEDRFFATVFFGSGIVFICMFFAAAAVVGAILVAFVANPEQLVNSATYHFARALAYAILNVYMIKAAAVFMVTTSTVVIYTGIAPRWLAMLSYALALLLLFASYYIRWSFLLFPLWVLLFSSWILIEKYWPASGTPIE
jgi:hypothetical protein